MNTVKTSELIKGSRVKLTCGWEATIMQKNAGRGSTVMCEVEGIVTEMGSVYTKDIRYALCANRWIEVEMSEAQKKNAARIQAMGF